MSCDFLMKIWHYLLQSRGFSSLTGLEFTPVGIFPTVNEVGPPQGFLMFTVFIPRCFSFPTVCLTGFWNPLHLYSRGSYMNRLTCWKLSLHNLRVPTLKDYPDRHTMWCKYLSERFTLTVFSEVRRVRSLSKTSSNSILRISSLCEFSGD